MAQPGLRSIRLVASRVTTIGFEDSSFEVTQQAGDGIRIALDADNYVVIHHQSREFASEEGIQTECVLSRERKGRVDYTRYFAINWEEDLSWPLLTFRVPPTRVVREYEKGQAIELGLEEEVREYHVIYDDGVEARFQSTEEGGFQFSFSTGFYGSFWKDADGSYTLKFKGDRLNPSEDAVHSQSKFIVSRSKYTGNLLLILQDAATVRVS